MSPQIPGRSVSSLWSVDFGATHSDLIKANLDTMVDYENSKLASYRSYSHDAIRIYGFTMKQTANGAVKAKMSIKDGLRLVYFKLPF